MGQALIARFARQQTEQAVSAAAADAGVPNNPDAAWWLKLLARALSVFAAIGCPFVSSCNIYPVFAVFVKNIDLCALGILSQHRVQKR